ncbi:hypothetical protein JGH11_19715 [Dysgonomonas sp. Marseille-P4677]|uniref:hypothetical protein n=1 Tax=Dysgonomonas sp. Marseille-P4677 TaxID=2364790 RepID=UPI00191368E1|nr:hypothetical protein [Dysgonomonas sp. Marseille-P4677]MBK5723099.1 hypothetical protein [Dysgonomonas sp. Marseille-P4677]
MPTPESIIEIQKERSLSLMQELDGIFNDMSKEDAMIDFLFTDEIKKRLSELYVGLIECFMTISQWSYVIGDAKQGDEYNQFYEDTLLSWRKLLGMNRGVKNKIEEINN